MRIFVKIIVVFLLIFWRGGNLFAVNTAPPIDTGVSTSLSGSGVLSACSREAVQSLESDSILSLDCTRIICKGNFWGKSATDVCIDNTIKTEGSEENARTYKDIYIRRPSREQATEAWLPKRFYLDGPRFSDAFNLSDEEREQLLGGSDSDSSSLFFWDIFSSQAFADTIYVTPWNQQERKDFAEVLDETANRIESVINSEFIPQITTLDPQSLRNLLYVYLLNAKYTTQFLAHALRPKDFSCPAPLLKLCELVDKVGFTPSWANLSHPNPSDLCDKGGVVGMVDFLQGFYLTQSLKQTAPLATIGYAASVAVHEAWHIVFHYLFEIYRSPSSWFGDPRSYFIRSLDPVLLFEDETTARYIQSIVYHFISGDNRHVPSVVLSCAGATENLYTELSNETQPTPLNDSDSSYASVFYEGALRNDQWDSVQDCVNGYNVINGSEPKYLDVLAKLTFTDQCIAEVLGETEGIGLFQKLHDDMMARGGPCVIPKVKEIVDARPCVIKQPDLGRDDLANLEMSLEELLESQPPPSDFAWQNPGNQTVGGEDPGMMPKGCEALFQQATSSQASAACYDWCWNHFPAGRDGGICERVTRYDAKEGNCNLSSGNKCEKALEDNCDTHPEWFGNTCVDTCIANPNLPHCDDMCRADIGLYGSLFCLNLCNSNSNYDFCPALCSYYPNASFCPQPNQGQTGGGGTGNGSGQTVDGISCSVFWITRENIYDIEMKVIGASCMPYVGDVMCCPGQLSGTPGTQSATQAFLFNDDRNSAGEVCFVKPGASNPYCNNRVYCGCGLTGSSSNGCCVLWGAPPPQPNRYYCGIQGQSCDCEIIAEGCQ